MNSFEQLGLPAPLSAALAQMKYETPTPIQSKAIPVALTGRDILGSAQTGTGKTAAFSIPLIARLMNNPRGTALVLTPTRELATQIMEIIKQLLSQDRSIKTALIIGGESMPNQIRMLKASPRIIIGTPGRINDHLERGTLRLHDANFLVLDETDRMLDMGFGVQLDAMFRYLPKVRQTLMFSATLPAAIVKLSEKYLNNPERVAVVSDSQTVQKLTQDVQYVAKEEKYTRLLEELDARDGSILVFVKTKRNSDQMAEKLQRKGYAAEAIHGDLRQNRRNKVIQMFRDQKYRILVATDVVARGLDIPHIEHVINYDLPMAAEDYIHRIGRTARAGAAGSALCLISPDDQKKWRAIERLLDPTNSKDDDLYDGVSANAKGKGRGNRRSFGGGGSFSKGSRPRSFDKPKRERGSDEKPSHAAVSRGDSRHDKPRTERSQSDSTVRAERPKRDGESSERRSDRAPRQDRESRGNDRPRTPRNQEDRPYRSASGEDRGERRPARDGDRPRTPRAEGGRDQRSDRPKREGGFGNNRREGGWSNPDGSRNRDSERTYAPRPDGERKPFRSNREEGSGERRSASPYGSRPERSDRNDRPRTGDDSPFQGKRRGPKREGARRDDAGRSSQDRPARDGSRRSDSDRNSSYSGDRKPFRDENRSERFGGRKNTGDKPFDARKRFTGNKRRANQDAA